MDIRKCLFYERQASLDVRSEDTVGWGGLVDREERVKIMTIEQPCIVVVEDEPSVLELVRDVLRLGAYRVVGVSDPKHLFEMLHSLHPDLFLIDIMLPGMSGIEVAETLRAGGQTAPIVTMSASKLMSQVASQSPAVDESIDKAFDVVALLNSIKWYLDRPSTRVAE
jgi:two-component system, OmpR family, response regulator